MYSLSSLSSLTHRFKDLTHQAELAVYRQLETNNVEGVALHEARPDIQYKELDFTLRLTGIARYSK